jgi:hypothetical protein
MIYINNNINNIYTYIKNEYWRTSKDNSEN